MDASRLDEDGFVIVEDPVEPSLRRDDNSFYSSDSDDDEADGPNRKLYGVWW